MKILNFGSLNIDKVYSVDHFVSAGETISSLQLDTFCGGKGLNQSIALARAGAEAYHAGAVGADGQMLAEALKAAGVDCKYLQTIGADSGHAVIQRTPSGQNCIIVCPGANGKMTKEYIDRVLSDFGAGDLLLLQNEINLVDYLMQSAKKRGMQIAFNASPISDAILAYPLQLVDFFLVNEIEGKLLSGCESEDFSVILQALSQKYPSAKIILTVGKDGVLYKSGSEVLRHGIYQVPVKDTTAAGDTFTGFFLASVARGQSAQAALKIASMASALSVSRAGASVSIPTMDEVLQFEREQ